MSLAIACVAVDSSPAGAWGGKKASAPATHNADGIKCPVKGHLYGYTDNSCTAALCAKPDRYALCIKNCGGENDPRLKNCVSGHKKASGAPVAAAAFKPKCGRFGVGSNCNAENCAISANYEACKSACVKPGEDPVKKIKACHTAHINAGGQNTVAQASAKQAKQAKHDAVAKAKAVPVAAPVDVPVNAPPPAEEAPADAPPADAPPAEEAPVDAPPADAPPAEEVPAE